MKLGVDRVVDFAEVTDTDLLEMSMSPIQRRRFRTAVAIDARPTLEADLVRAEDDALKSTVGMRAVRCLDLLWDSFCCCHSVMFCSRDVPKPSSQVRKEILVPDAALVLDICMVAGFFR